MLLTGDADKMTSAINTVSSELKDYQHGQVNDTDSGTRAHGIASPVAALDRVSRGSDHCLFAALALSITRSVTQSHCDRRSSATHDQ